MNLSEFLEKVVKTLQSKKIKYALAGGLVASLYRANERLTKDLDFLILAGAETESLARSIIKEFGLTPHIVRKADLEGGPMFAIKRKSTPAYIIAGRAKDESSKIGLDFILPEMPWFEKAIARAAQNQIDFGFGKVPCLTKEDIIIAKLYSLKNDSKRFNDLDDLKSIFQAQQNLDLAYLASRMQELKIIIPDSIKDFIPKPLILISKKILREVRKRSIL